MRIIQHAVNQSLQAVQFTLQFLQTVGRKLQSNIRRHLAHNAAHILASLYRAAIETVCDIAVLAARDTAHIIAHMRVSHRAAVGTALQNTVGVSRNAAGIVGHSVFRDFLSFQQTI